MLFGKKLAYLGNCASVSKNLEESLKQIIEHTSLNITCVLSPQHGWHAVEQANMIPSSHSVIYDRPLFSLYTNKTRTITSDQLNYFDGLIIDLQDVGCRVYTYVTAVLQAVKICAENKKSIYILDRPNPIGRKIEGFTVQTDFYSMVGVWSVPMNYGMTLGELVQIFISVEKIDLELKIFPMEGYHPEKQGWPEDRTWIHPSPNMTGVECAKCYGGTVLLEGTAVSEGRGTTCPLRVFGFPKMDSHKILKTMENLNKDWMKGCILKPCYFKPTFDKFKGEVCSGIQIYPQSKMNPFRLISLFLKAVYLTHPKDWFLQPPYEYEYKKMPLDILSGDSFLRQWAADPQADLNELEEKLIKDERQWLEKSRPFHIY